MPEGMRKIVQPLCNFLILCFHCYCYSLMVCSLIIHVGVWSAVQVVPGIQVSYREWAHGNLMIILHMFQCMFVYIFFVYNV